MGADHETVNPPPPYSPDVGKPVAGRSATAEERHSFLKSANLPAGIIDEIVRSCEEFSQRIWIIDNSGSMGTSDGNRIIEIAGHEKVANCTRWTELADSLQWHAAMAAHLAAPTEFRLLNRPRGESMSQMLHCGVGSEPISEVRAMEDMLKELPAGMTPLCAQIREVVQRLRRDEASLRSRGKRCLVVIASDGKASDGDVEEALRPMLHLPVFLVVRLCTDDSDVVDYWNKVDEDLEIEMDVLDDVCSEAVEVTRKNRWLTYGVALHRLREWGCTRKVMDLLDEKALSPEEFLDFAQLLLGRDACAELPSPVFNWVGFNAHLERVLHQTPDVWCPVHKKRFSSPFCLLILRLQH